MRLPATLLIAALLLPSSPARRGPHPDPAPGAVLEAFPGSVSAWHGVADGKHDALHRASHVVVKGPDGRWVDGSVETGEKVLFRAEKPADLGEGEYTASAWGRWTSGVEEPAYTWTFTVRRAK